jgi:hypothetical protein
MAATEMLTPDINFFWRLRRPLVIEALRRRRRMFLGWTMAADGV